MGVPPNHPSYCVLYMGRPMVWGTYIWRNPYVQWTSINMLFTKHGELTSWCMKHVDLAHESWDWPDMGCFYSISIAMLMRKRFSHQKIWGNSPWLFPCFPNIFRYRFPRQPMWPGPKKIVRSPSHRSSQAPWNSSENDVKTWFSWDILGRFQP